ncbi:MAG: PGN_0703 family putative restriction endonuclease [Armatimonadota bacterium]
MTLKRGVKTKYDQILLERFWKYRENRFINQDHLFDKPLTSKHDRPPVFNKEDASQNVIVKSYSYNNQVLNAIKPYQRHRWFGSMKSSQVLAQSVFSNLQYHNKLHILKGLTGDDDQPLFIRNLSPKCSMEFEVDYLGEQSGRGTNVDVFFNGDYRVAVECKIAETEIGSCSRPRQESGADDYCNGSYSHQHKGDERCSLTAKGIEYWKHIPDLFTLDSAADYDTCPLRETYQLVRNILAACVQSKSGPTPDMVNGHAVLLYDDRNPEFHDCCGKGMNAWQNTKDALKPEFKHLLQKCTWQELVAELRTDPELKWLTDELNEKYGF